jgi:hypothetical protein
MSTRDIEPDRDDIDAGIALRKARARMNLRIVANRLSAGDDFLGTVQAVYSGSSPTVQFAADIRRIVL